MRCEQLESRDVPSWFVAAGGEVVDTGSGHLFRPFESSFAGPVKLAVHDQDLFVGAGIGGGPRYQIRDVSSGTVKLDAFVPGADPASRSGVDGVWVDGQLPVGPASLRAQGDPEVPASAPAIVAVQNMLDLLPSQETNYLASHGGAVYVYPGPGITILPRFANLAGRLTDAGGDGNRTYDQVPAVGGAGGAVVPAGVDAFTLHHELGHVLESEMPAAIHDSWVSMFPSITFPTAYEAAQETEAFAESVRRWSDNIQQPDPRIDPLIDSIFIGR